MDMWPLLEDALERLEWFELMTQVSELARFSQTKERLRSLNPWLEVEERERWVRLTQEALHLWHQGLKLELEDVAFEETLSRARVQAVLSSEDLWNVALLLDLGERCATYGKSSETGELSVVFSSTPQLPQFLRILKQSVAPGGRILDTASMELRRARQSLLSVESQLTAELDRLLARTHVREALQDNVWMQRDGHYVLPVKIENRHAIPGIPRGLSGSGATVFIEPSSLSHLRQAVDEARIFVGLEETKVLSSLSSMAAKYYNELQQISHSVLFADMLMARTALANQMAGIWASFHNELEKKSRFYFKNARHPLSVLQSQKSVPNTLELSPPARVLVLSGPNAGGKTVAMRTVGLLTLMAKAGFAIPVDEAHIFELPRLFADVGDRQSREENLSTFSGHLKHILSIASWTVPGTLVLLDEGFVGTDPEMGFALARATLEHFAELGATVVITTHFAGLKTLAGSNKWFANASMEFSQDSLTPTYRLLNGIPGKSYALELGQRLGFPQSILNKAKGYYGSERERLDGLIADLQSKEQTLEAERVHVGQLKNELENELEKTQDELSRLQNARRTLIEQLETRVQKRLHAFSYTLNHALEEDDPVKAIEGADIAYDETLMTKAQNEQAKRKQDFEKQKKNTPKTLSSFADLSSLKSSLPTTTSPNPNTQTNQKPPTFTSKQIQNLQLAAEEKARDLQSWMEKEKQAVDKVLKELVPQSQLTSGAPRLTPLIGGPQVWRKGMNVCTDKFSGLGQVVAEADAKGLVTCQFGILTVKLPAAQLKLPGDKASQSKEVKAKVQPIQTDQKPSYEESQDADWGRGFPQTRESTCDLRGLYVETALETLERFLDEASRKNMSVVYAIHGHGFGKVKAAVRTSLKNSPYARRFRPGQVGEGGDGVTVIELY